MKKIHLKKHRKKASKINIFLIILFLIIIAIIFCLKFISKKVTPVLMEYAELQAGKIATYIIRQSVNESVTKEISVDDLFIITKDSDGNIKTIDFNPINVSKMLSKVTETVNDYLTNLESNNFENMDIPKSISDSFRKQKKGKGIIFEIPSGIVLKNSILSNSGPKIPVKLTLVGDIDSDIKTKITNYGINNALLEVSVKIHVVEQVILPITSKRIKVEMNIPIAIKMIQGEIPEYYLKGLENGTTISVPSK